MVLLLFIVCILYIIISDLVFLIFLFPVRNGFLCLNLFVMATFYFLYFLYFFPKVSVDRTFLFSFSRP